MKGGWIFHIGIMNIEVLYHHWIGNNFFKEWNIIIMMMIKVMEILESILAADKD